MNYNDFIKLLESNKLKPVYLLYGEEYYLIDDLVKRIKDSYVDERFETLNYTVLEGRELTFDKLMNACETLPFMADKKIVIVKDFPLFKNKDEREEREGLDGNDDRKLFADYIEGLEDYISLIFIEKMAKVRKNNILYKRIKRAGDVVELKKLRGRDLNIWIQNKFKEYNRTISRYDIGYFIEQTSYLDSNHKRNLYDLENEIFKLSNYVSENEQVKKNHIDHLIAKPLEMNIFNLLDSISRKDGERAIILFNEMYMSNEPILIILHMIVRQFRNMLHIKSLKAQGYTEGKINSKVKLNPYEYRKLLGQCNNFSIAQLERSLFHCLEADKSIKTSWADGRLVLEILISNLCFNT